MKWHYLTATLVSVSTLHCATTPEKKPSSPSTVATAAATAKATASSKTDNPKSSTSSDAKPTGTKTTKSTADGKSATTGNSIEFSSKKVPNEGFKLTHTEAAKFTMKSGGEAKYRALWIIFANYDRKGKTYHPNAKVNGERRIIMAFSGSKIVKGKYTTGNGRGEGLGIGVTIEQKGDDDSVSALGAEGHAEITKMDDKTVEGTLDIKNSEGTSVKATFKLPYHTRD